MESPNRSSKEELTFAKEQLGGASPSDGKLLGLPYDKQEDTSSVVLKNGQPKVMKRALLPYLARIYDPLDLTPAVTLIGIQHYCHICDSKLAWDAQRPGPFLTRWKDWLLALTDAFTVPQDIAVYWEPILQLTFHAFGDVTSKRVCGTVYAVVQQTQGTTQRLICNKSYLARRNMPVPRLELIAGHYCQRLSQK